MTDFESCGIAQRDRVKVLLGGLDLEDRQVVCPIGAHYRRPIFGSVRQCDLETLGVGDHMVVGQHVTLQIQHRAAPGLLAWYGAKEETVFHHR